MTLVTVEKITKSFGKTIVIKDVSFTVAPGRITGLLGPKGYSGNSII